MTVPETLGPGIATILKAGGLFRLQTMAGLYQTVLQRA